tara:strand:+ start:124 stop:546 length:423 start_codon:yes stop_codon:yes gene_type:complete
MNMRKIILFALIFLLVTPINSSDKKEFFSAKSGILPAEEVFEIRVLNNLNTINIRWAIREGYYMYLDSIKFQDFAKPYKILNSEISSHEDEYFGKTKIIKKIFEIEIKTKDLVSMDGLVVQYQGCSEQGFCYPTKKHKIL